MGRPLDVQIHVVYLGCISFEKIEIPAFEWDTSIPMKYFKYPRSLILNRELSAFFSYLIEFSLLPTMIMSSTWMRRHL